MFKIYLLCVTYITCVNCTTFQENKVFSTWRDFPYKTLLNVTSSQPECQNAYQNFLFLLDNNDLNALRMLDATAKLPSGILNGNVNQYGDFNECMEVPIAQYCLVEMDLEPLWKQPYSKYKNLVHSFYFFKETFKDPAHRIPGFNMVRWGFCIPRECSKKDLETSLEQNFGVLAQVREGMCQKSANSKMMPWTIGDYIARIFLVLIHFTVLLSSIIDYYHARGQSNRNILKEYKGKALKILMCFSLQRNFSKFMEVKDEDSNEISGLHGIRALNALALLMSHKAVSLFFNPFMNRTSTVDTLTQPWTIIAKNAIVYTDSFMLLSGLLNANSLFTDLNNGQSMKFKDRLINRIFRILPNVIALILFCTYILPTMGSGPLWPIIINHHSVLCKKYMWRNLLFIHNYFGFENMCLTHTHQLGIDMQLFLITPIVSFLIWKHGRMGLFSVGFLALTSTVLRFWVAYENELSNVVYFGMPISKMFSSANMFYILPTHRATIYLTGVYLSYLLRFSKQHASLSRVQVMCLWSFFIPLFLWTWVGPYHMAQKNYVYDKLEASLITAASPIFWGASLAFLIYAINNDNAGWLGKILCWKYFQVITKLAYALYLVQFPVFFYNVGLTKHPEEYKPYYQLQIFETIAIILCSVLLVLLIEMPFQNIKKVLFDSKRTYFKQTVSENRLIMEKRKFKSG